MSWWEPFADAWKWYYANRADLTPIGAFLGGVVIAWADRHRHREAARQHPIYGQTGADRFCSGGWETTSAALKSFVCAT